ncbi:MAG: TIGR02281 family clan AA aspartic protease [Spirochaetales bacterium]|nr:TIGR02281 family clan AA aspartic protease [Spirochaetales bacterium]
MKYILNLLSVLMLTVLGVDAVAQKKNAESDYNLKKAYEVLREENDEGKALELVGKQLRETPDNVDALILRVRLLRHKKDLASAIQSINHAIKVNNPKKSGTPMSTLYWWKATLYDDAHDYENASASFKKAYDLSRKDDKDNRHSIGFSYAQSLHEQGLIDRSDAVYREMLAEDEADCGAMVGLSRNMIDRGQCREAIELLDKCQRLDDSYAEVYRFKMEAYDKLGETTKAVDAGLDWFDKNDDASTAAIIRVLKKRPNYAEACLKSRANKSENPFSWKALLCEFYEQTHQYAEAVKTYDSIEAEFGHYDSINYYRSLCYSELGLNESAIADISKIMEKEPEWNSLCQRGDFYRLSGNLDAAIADFSAAIDMEPSYAYPYYKRGWCLEMKGDRKGAIEDYSIGIEMDDDYPYLYLMRGELLLFDGKKAEAEADFEAVIQKDTVAEDGSCRQYALHFLGRDEEAEEWMNKIIASDPEEDGNYYDQACLYSRMGRHQESVAALRVAFEKGYRDFAHIRLDDDMDAVRELPEFKALMQEYETRHEAYLKAFELTTPEKNETVTEIAVKRNPGGTFEIPCDINGLQLQMIFDTGASDVTISSVEANFMLKNGYLSEKDIKGKRYYQVANGQLSEGTVITLREVKIGDAVLHNVDASVVKSQKAPLLLGQSAMERFGTITIDNQNNKLIIKQ